MSDLSRVNTELAALDAAWMALKLRIKRREVVARADVERLMQAQGHRIRDAILSAPPRLAPEFAADLGRDSGLIARELTRLLRAELTELADSGENLAKSV